MSVPGGAYRSLLHRLDVIVGLVVVLAGAKTLFTYLPDISVSRVEVATATVREHADATPVEPSPPIELNIGDGQRNKLESREATVADDDNHASKRHADAACLPKCETIAEQRKSPQRDA